MKLSHSTLALSLFCCSAGAFADQSSPASGKIDVSKVPPLVEMLGKSYEWTVEKLGQPSYPSDWTTSRSKSDRGEKQITFGIRHFQVKDSSTPSGTRTLQVSFLGVENGPKLIRSLQWNDLKPQGFDAAFDTNKLTLTDFEFVKETSIAHGWDVTTLRHKDKKHVHLELTRTESSYRIKLSVEAGLEFFEKEKAAPSPL